jgi:hypothetical protein
MCSKHFVRNGLGLRAYAALPEAVQGEHYMKYYIIEHPTRGVLQSEPNPNTGKPRFSWSKSRTDENNARYFLLRSAIQAVLSEGLPEGCQVREYKPEALDDTHSLAEVWPVVWPIPPVSV